MRSDFSFKMQCPVEFTGRNSHPTLLCVCVFFPFILDVKLVGSTSRGHTGFLTHLLSAMRAFIFLATRIQPFLSLVDREVESRKNLSCLLRFELTSHVSEGYEITN